MCKNSTPKREIALNDEMNSLLKKLLKNSTFSDFKDIKSLEISLNGKINGKIQEYVDIKEKTISSPDDLVSGWLSGMIKFIENPEKSVTARKRRDDFRQLIIKNKDLYKYVTLSLEKAFWQNYDSYTKNKPSKNDSEIWIGSNDAMYGIFITPRFNKNKDKWENDKSEIRKFNQNYWSIGHILKTGIIRGNSQERISFETVQDYLDFFKDLVKKTTSPHEERIATMYSDYVINSNNKNDIQLLIPQFRYGKDEVYHKFRLDFTVINPFTFDKIGFELSPSSTHGVKVSEEKSKQDIKNEAQDILDYELEKRNEYIREYNLSIITYNDDDLKNPEKIFEEIKKYLEPPIPIEGYTSLDDTKEYFFNKNIEIKNL